MRRLWLAVLACGCGADFDPASYVKDLRVLTIKAEPPELAAGETTTLTALIAPIEGPEGVDGGVPEPTLEWALCLLAPAAGSRVNPDCIETETAPYLVPLPTQGLTTTVTMPVVDPTKLGLPDETTGLYVPIRLIVRQGEAKVISFYRLRVHLFGVPNRNPLFHQLFFDRGNLDMGDPMTPLETPPPLEVHLPEQLSLRATTTPESTETYQKLEGDPRDLNFVTEREQMRYLWYAPAGAFETDATGDPGPFNARPFTRIDFAHRPPLRFGRPFTLYVVVTDGRGGIDFTTRDFVLR